MLDRFVGNGVGLPGARMAAQSADFVVVEGARTAAAENGNLIARFVDGTVAVNSF